MDACCRGFRSLLRLLVAAALFAYLADPLVDRLERRMNRGLAVSLVFLVGALVVVFALLLLVPMRVCVLLLMVVRPALAGMMRLP